MSLSLLQGYSSTEEETEDQQNEQDPNLLLQHSSSGDEDDDDNLHPSAGTTDRRHSSSALQPSGLLPSALDAFHEIAGPPAFLNNSVEEYDPAIVQQQGRRGGRRNNKEKKDLPAGAVVEAKPQLTGIHERVRSDIDGQPTSDPPGTNLTEGGKRIVTVANPKAEDAAELLRMCVQCGVPKTYTNARGMVCPVCGDRPPVDDSNDLKKKGSTVKDKEKIKRMRGQSSHASWKSETEMQLRQHFD